jgi:hypothetical protein
MEGVFGLPTGPPRQPFQGLGDGVSFASTGPVVFGGSNLIPVAPANAPNGLGGFAVAPAGRFSLTGNTVVEYVPPVLPGNWGPPVGVGALGASNTGNTAGNTGTGNGTWVLAGTNMVTVSESTTGIGPNTLWLNATQTNQSAIKGFGASNTGNTAGNTGISTGIDWVLAGSTNITVSESTAAGGPNTLWLSVPNVAAGNITFSASNTSTAVGAITFSNSNGVTFGLGTGANAGIMTASVAAGGAFSAGASNLGNTAGSTGVTGTRLVLVGTNDLSLSQSTDANGGTVTFNVADSNSFGASNLGNTLGTSGVATGNNIRAIIIATDGLSISQSVNGASVTETIVPWYLSQWDVHSMMLNAATNSTLGQNTLYFLPFDLPAALSAYRVNFFLSVATTVTASNTTGRGGYTFSAALYSKGTGASTDRISSFWSGTAGIAMTMNSNTQLVITNLAGIKDSANVSTVGTSISNANATTYPQSSMAGFRVVPLPISSTLTPGRYWLAFANSSSGAGAGCSINCSVFQTTQNNWIAWQPFGTNSSASNAIVYPVRDGIGSYSATSGAFPGSVPLTSDSIRGAVTQTGLWFNFSAYTTSTNML